MNPLILFPAIAAMIIATAILVFPLGMWWQRRRDQRQRETDRARAKKIVLDHHTGCGCQDQQPTIIRLRP